MTDVAIPFLILLFIPGVLLSKCKNSTAKPNPTWIYKSGVKEDDLVNVLSVWTKTIDVQQHFNDIGLRIRSLALTAFTFFMAGIGYAEKENLAFRCYGIILPYSFFISFIGIITLISFYYMDKCWYHPLLKGAVNHSNFIEERWMNCLPEIQLSKTIGGESRQQDTLKRRIHSDSQYEKFYYTLIIIFSVFGTSMFLIHQ